MSYKLLSIDIERFRKIIKTGNANIGKKLTVISGHNGVGKSSIMSLIASSSGTNNKRLNNTTFHPYFTDYFYLDPLEPFNTYKTTLKYRNSNNFIFAKKVSFNDYTKANRGIRPIPRATNVKDETVTEAGQATEKATDIKPSQRVPIPTIYLSLSRMMPPIETNATTVDLDSKNEFISNSLDSKYKEWYETVLPNSFDTSSQAQEMTKRNINKTRSFIPLNDANALTQSVGQDNLGSIIFALIDFYYLKLKLKSNYPGGILCIDEIEASLHPNAQKMLFLLLSKLSSELDLQIIITSHSLTILEEILSLQNRNPDDYKLIYFKGRNSPSISKLLTYRDLKADLFNEMNTTSPQLKIYCEDELSKITIEALLSACHDNNISIEFSNFDIIPINLGNQDLKGLPDIDDYFNKITIILDGDSKLKNRIKIEEYLANPTILANHNNDVTFPHNFMTLPGYFSTEEYAYLVINEYIEHETDHLLFWRNLESNPTVRLYTSDKIQDEYLLKDVKFDQLHRKAKYTKFLKDTKILSDYYSCNNEELKAWANKFNQLLNQQSSIFKAQGY
ncbi:AAA family ATPase [Latilactobacillus sakei]|uniref:AAA family ATPase n=1 Tax=Latilactobacillus sakei TaxID=1599 RepID=UPI003F529E06